MAISDITTLNFTPNWIQGTFIGERIDLIEGLCAADCSAEIINLAEIRVQNWRDATGLPEDQFWGYLQKTGVERDDLVYILGKVHVDNTQSMRVQVKPDWVQDLEMILKCAYEDQIVDRLEVITPGDPNQIPRSIPFWPFLRPFLQMGAGHLRQKLSTFIDRLKSASHIGFASLETKLLSHLAQRLLIHATRTLTLELNIARLQGNLQGDSTDERYRFFTDDVLSQKTAFAELIEEYPVLARLIITTTRRWSNTIMELFIRLEEDRELITRTFWDGNNIGNLIEAETGFSDLHRCGRSVFRLKFDSGLKLIYKPRSLAVDCHFQFLLDWLNTLGESPSFPLLKVENRGDYGWVEFIEYCGCKTEAEVSNFYNRQGGYLALLYLLEATDMHAENLLACGEFPYLVDLEALFHHRHSVERGDTAYQLAARELGDSVLRTGLLPIWLWTEKDRGGVEISGLGGEEGQQTPRPVPMLDQPFTDNMRVVRRYASMPAGQHRPMLRGLPVDTSAYVDDVVEGFRSTYDLLMKNRSSLESEILPMFDCDVVRHILRPTRSYALFLQEGHHPDYLRDGVDREILLDRMWLAVQRNSFMAQVIPSEKEDLLLGDIPIFTAQTNARHLWDSHGRKLQNFFTKSSMEVVLDKLKCFNEKDRDQQLLYLRGTMASIDRSYDYSSILIGDECTQHNTTHSIDINKAAFLEAAEAIGEKLHASAFLGEKDACWIGLTLDRDNRWILNPIDISLYGGVGGLALFFGYLADATDRTDFKEIARAALEPILQLLEMEKPPIHNIGAFSGITSLLYVLSHLAALWEDPDLLAKGIQTLDYLETQIEQNQSMDIMDGAAGCAIVLRGLYQITGKERLLELAIKCGRRLQENAITAGSGLAWKIPGVSEPLAGFAHGVAGIAWSLMALASETNLGEFQELAMASLAYERSLFRTEQGNWIDVRNLENVNGTAINFIPTRWCHGAPGVALGRLLSLSYLDEPKIRNEIEVALQTTLREGFGGSHCLCHGDLGNADILLHAGEILEDPFWSEIALQRVTIALQTAMREGRWRCGLPQKADTPGLMVGLSGIGYGLMRMWSPDRIPSVVRLSPPKV
jgi:type 2 lantibiotic biosynthesis protein LanM